MSDLAHRGAVPPDPTRQAAQRLLGRLSDTATYPEGSLFTAPATDVRLVAEAVMGAPASGRASSDAELVADGVRWEAEIAASGWPPDDDEPGEAAKPVVYLAGPYSSPDPVENMHRAIKIADSLLDVCVPMIPHLTGTWHMVSPKPYPVWLDLDIALMERCDVVYRFDGASAGADGEVAHAQQIGLPVVFSEDDLRSLIPGLARRGAALQAEVVRLREALEAIAGAINPPDDGSDWDGLGRMEMAQLAHAALKEDA